MQFCHNYLIQESFIISTLRWRAGAICIINISYIAYVHAYLNIHIYPACRIEVNDKTDMS